MKKLILIVGLMVMLVISMGWGFSKAYAELTVPPMRLIFGSDPESVPDFYIGKYEVTYGQYTEFEANPDQHHVGGDHPVEMVTWYDAALYCNALTTQEYSSSDQVYDINKHGSERQNNWSVDHIYLDRIGYRLPTEDEYYKAAAWVSGTTYTTYGFGRNTIDGQDANYEDSGDPFDNNTTPVGFYDGTLYNPGGGGSVGNGNEFQTRNTANQYGLYDMSGNVWEWNNDLWNSERVDRGGGWEDSTYYLASSFRGPYVSYLEDLDLGFRVARLPEPSTLLLFFPGLLGLIPFLRRKR